MPKYGHGKSSKILVVSTHKYTTNVVPQKSLENDFLGALRQLKTELLEAMDMKLAVTLSHLHQSQPPVMVPQYIQPSHMMKNTPTISHFQNNLPPYLAQFMQPVNKMSPQS